MSKLVDSLYTEALVLADEVRTYFDETCMAERDALAPHTRVLFSCESLNVTTKLMHMITWLLCARAAHQGFNTPLVPTTPVDQNALAMLPLEAQQLIAANQALYQRVARLEAQLHTAPHPSAVNQMMSRLSSAF